MSEPRRILRETPNPLFAGIDVSGPDAAAFVQGQVTQDVRRLAEARGLPAAWCNAAGRVIAVLRLQAKPAGGIGLIVPASAADALLARLSMFRLRARVELARAGAGWRAFATRSAGDLRLLDAAGLLPPPGPFACRAAGGLVAFDTGAADRCIEVFGTAEAFAGAGAELAGGLDESGWRRALIEAGVPQIEAGSAEAFTPHMLNLDVLGAVSFDKGCYTGQEVIARTQHLGRAKRRLLRYRVESGTAVPGDRLRIDGGDAGQVVDAAGDELLAVVPLELRRATLDLDGRAATPVGLPYPLPPL